MAGDSFLRNLHSFARMQQVVDAGAGSPVAGFSPSMVFIFKKKGYQMFHSSQKPAQKKDFHYFVCDKKFHESR
ncbi:hypothetical protein [Chitinophaga sp. CB10]|uniref:hypothetical protein n=1 Tax=Chitinophaga sp. CB10 TaxID=1891659 RepID=UPI0025C4B5AA|nr:hypothetical protein [Chitinophaga sp. CB10]